MTLPPWGAGMPQDTWRLPPQMQLRPQQQRAERAYHPPPAGPPYTHPLPPLGPPLLPGSSASSLHVTQNTTWMPGQDTSRFSFGHTVRQAVGHNSSVDHEYRQQRQPLEHESPCHGTNVFSLPDGGRKSLSWASSFYDSPPTLGCEDESTTALGEGDITPSSSSCGVGGRFSTRQEQRRSLNASDPLPRSELRSGEDRLAILSAQSNSGRYYKHPSTRRQCQQSHDAPVSTAWVAPGQEAPPLRSAAVHLFSSPTTGSDLQRCGQERIYGKSSSLYAAPHDEGYDIADQKRLLQKQHRDEGEVDGGDQEPVSHLPNCFRDTRHDLRLPMIGEDHNSPQPVPVMAISPKSRGDGARHHQEYHLSSQSSSSMMQQVQDYAKEPGSGPCPTSVHHQIGYEQWTGERVQSGVGGGGHGQGFSAAAGRGERASSWHGASVSIDVIDGVASQLRKRMTADRVRGASLTRLVQGTLDQLGLMSLESAGIHLVAVPTFQAQAELEHRVNAAIRSYLPGRNVTTVFDVVKHVVEQEGVSTFEDLGLGAPAAYPLIAQRFYRSGKDGQGLIHNISESEVISTVPEYASSEVGSPNLEGFMEFLAKKHGLSDPDSLGIRIMDFRNLQGMIPKVPTLGKDSGPAAEEEQDHEQRQGEQGVPRSKVMPRVMKFLEKVGEDEERQKVRQEEGVEEWVHRWNLSRLKVGRAVGVAAAHLTDDSLKGCPYPSALEERLLQAKQAAIVISSDEDEEEEEEGAHESVETESGDNEEADGWIPAEKLIRFASKWKSVCQKSPTIKKVLVKMLKGNAAKLPKTVIRKFTCKKSWFQHSPLQEILCIAASSIAAGLWDTVPCRDGEIKPVTKKKNVDERELVEAVIRHFMANQPQPNDEKDSNKSRSQEHETWSVLRWAHDCERSLVERYHVDSFADLRKVSFLKFVVDHADAFPENMAFELGLKCRPVICRAMQQQLVPCDRLVRFVQRILHTWEGVGEAALKKCIATNLCLHFRVASVEHLGYGSVDDLVAEATQECQKQAVDESLSYVGTLLVSSDQFTPTNVTSGEEGFPPSCKDGGGKRGTDGTTTETSVVGVLGSMDDAAALACLQLAPMLVDLADWSSWQAVFAPSLGPLLDWLEQQVDRRTHDLHILILPDGRIMRVNASSTPDDFLKSSVTGNARAAAIHLVSMVASHGGVSHTPLALLKLHASAALSIVLSSFAMDTLQGGAVADEHNSAGKMESYLPDPTQDDINDAMARAGASQAEETMGKRVERETMDDERGNICKLPKWSSQQTRAAEFVVQCIMAAPADMRPFVGEVLLPSLSSLVSGSYGLLLQVCNKSEEQTAMLHALGLQMGVAEWAEDYRTRVLSKPLSHAGQSGLTSDMSMEDNDYVNLTAALSELETGDLKPGLERKPFEEKTADGQTTGGSAGVKLEAVQEEMYGVEYEREATQKARALIEMIRVEEFGMDCEMGKTELAKRQNERMGRALKRLSNDLYSKDSHFVLELVQNADDNLYDDGVCPSLYFILAEDRIIVLNNEKGFTDRNMRALCDVGNSTKANKGTGFIGEKGIGFKSVFRMTDAPEIHSNGFHVKFDIQENKSLGFILPSWLEGPSLHLKDLVPSEFGSSGGESIFDNSGSRWATRIDLPLKDTIKSLGAAGLGSRFSDIHPSLLLFLHKLRRIDIVDTMLEKRISMIREDAADGMVRVAHDGGSAIWLVRRECFLPKIPRGALQVGKTEVALAFPLRERTGGSLEVLQAWQYAFAYLPLRSYGLRFVIQGDFVVPSSREDVDRDSAWNQWLRSKVVDVLVSSVDAFKKVRWHGVPSDGSKAQTGIATAVSNFLAFVPLEGEVVGFFSCLPRMIMSRLRAMAFLPIESEQLVWALPCQVIAGWDDLAECILPAELLKEELGLSLLHRKVVVPEPMRASLGIQVYGEKILLQVLRLLLDKDLVKSRGIHWMAGWMAAMYRLIGDGWSKCTQKTARRVGSNHSAELGQIITELRSLPFLPLTDDSCAAVSSSNVWYTPGGSKRVLPTLVCHPLVKKELRIVNPLLLSCVAQIPDVDVKAASQESGSPRNEIKGVKASEVDGLLELLGVRPLTEHAVVECHILSAMQSNAVYDKHREVLFEYLSFIREHLSHACRQCEDGERDRLINLVRQSVVLVTNGGLKKPAREPVHFSAAMGNLLQVDAILNGLCFPWNKVDDGYLRAFAKGQSNKGNRDRVVQDCRCFLQKLGVTDFVCVREETVCVGRGEESKWKGEKWPGSVEGQLWSVHDYVSSELEQLLDALCSRERKMGSETAPAQDSAKLTQSKLMVETMDKLWTGQYEKFLPASYCCRSIDGRDEEPVGETLSSFAMLLRDKWLIPGNDGRLHPPSSLFEEREELKQLLGNLVTFATPHIKASSFVKALGLKRDVSVAEMIGLFRKFCTSGRSTTVSVTQMAHVYGFFQKLMPTHRGRIEAMMTEIPSVFVPYSFAGSFTQCMDSHQEGQFYWVSEVWWCDPTGVASLLCCDDTEWKYLHSSRTKQDRKHARGNIAPDIPLEEDDVMNLDSRNETETGSGQVGKMCSVPLEPLYTDLKDFFVSSSLVRENLSVRGQLRLLERFVTTAPAHCAVSVGKVMGVFKSWASLLSQCGFHEDSPEHSTWMMLSKAAVFPTVDGKWVPAADCYAPDDKKLCSCFEGHEKVQFLCLSRKSELAGRAKKIAGKAERRKAASEPFPEVKDESVTLQEITPLLRAVGVRFISEEVKREVITGTRFDNTQLRHLVVQLLFMLARFIHHLQPAEYRKFVCHPAFMHRIEHLECHVWGTLNMKYRLSGVEREVCHIPYIALQDGEAVIVHKLHTSPEDGVAIIEALQEVFPTAVKSSLSNVKNLLAATGKTSCKTLGDLALRGGGIPEMSQEEVGRWCGRLGCPAELISKPLQPAHVTNAFHAESQAEKLENLSRPEVKGEQLRSLIPGNSTTSRVAPPHQPSLTSQQMDVSQIVNRGTKRGALDDLEHQDKKLMLNTSTTGLDTVEQHQPQLPCVQGDHDTLQGSVAESCENLSPSVIVHSSGQVAGGVHVGPVTSPFPSGTGAVWRQPDVQVNRRLEDFAILEAEVRNAVHEEFRATAHSTAQTPDVVPDLERSAAQMSEEDTIQLGRSGEEFAYRHLLLKYQGDDEVKIVWLNQAGETGSCFDIMVTRGDKVEAYIEVKSTIGARKQWFPISYREWQFAIAHGEAFHILRVYGIGGMRSYRIMRLSNPAKLWMDGVIKLCLAM